MGNPVWHIGEQVKLPPTTEHRKMQNVGQLLQ